MRLLNLALCATVAIGLLAGCSGSNLGSASSTPNTGAAQSHFTNGHFIPQWSALASLIPVELRPSGPARVLAKIVPERRRKKSHIYASEFYGTSIWGYRDPNTNDSPPICSVSPVSSPNGIAVDGKGNLIDPDGGTRTVIVFKGPGMCGPPIGSVSDPYGQPSDATSVNAATGTIVVANIFGPSGAGSISLCTLPGGCFANLTNPHMYEVYGVAMAKNGDCWASAANSTGTATLTYFKGCTGHGRPAKHYLNAYPGGLDIDNAGNLVSISGFNSEVYVYKGCNAACKLVGGPFALENQSIFGHLDQKSKHFAAADYTLGEVDVYNYSPTNITYSYEFNNGLSSSLDVEGAAFNPRSNE